MVIRVDVRLVGGLQALETGSAAVRFDRRHLFSA